MVRGTQKKVIYLKNPRSTYFDEAYFILRDGADRREMREGEMVEEAGRIIEENQTARGKKNVTKILLSVTLFLLGALTSCAVFLLILP